MNHYWIAICAALLSALVVGQMDRSPVVQPPVQSRQTIQLGEPKIREKIRPVHYELEGVLGEGHL